MTELADSKAESLKDQGNTEFKSANYLKAAALYTKAIKEEPENPVLYRCGCWNDPFSRQFGCKAAAVYSDECLYVQQPVRCFIEAQQGHESSGRRQHLHQVVKQLGER